MGKDKGIEMDPRADGYFIIMETRKEIRKNHTSSLGGLIIMEKEEIDRNGNEDVEITDFNREMSREERNYYGREFDENR